MKQVLVILLLLAAAGIYYARYWERMQERNICLLSIEAGMLECSEVKTLAEGGFLGNEATCLCTTNEIEVMFNAELASRNNNSNHHSSLDSSREENF